MTMNVEESTTAKFLAKIKAKGYWRIVVRPTVFERQNLAKLSDVRGIIESSQVNLGGWSYPYTDVDAVRDSYDSVEGFVDWSSHIEYWRAFRSGQFAHLLAAREDYEDLAAYLPKGHHPLAKQAGYLSTYETIYLVTSIFEFAARLASKGILVPAAFVSISLHNMRGHQLTTFDTRNPVFEKCVRKSKDPIVYETEVSDQELMAHTDELAREAIVEIFEAFNWNEPSLQMMAEEQRKLRERRL